MQFSRAPDGKRFAAQLRFFLVSHRVLLLVSVTTMATIIADISLGTDATTRVRKLWSTHIDPFVGIATFMVAVAVLLVQNGENWKRQLPKRLTVLFMLDGVEIMRCDKAYLTDASGIRELAQTIGRQMADPLKFKAMLPFRAPTVRLADTEIVYEKEDGHHIQHYTVVLELAKRPKEVATRLRIEWKWLFGPDNLVNIYPDGHWEVRRTTDLDGAEE